MRHRHGAVVHVGHQGIQHLGGNIISGLNHPHVMDWLYLELDIIENKYRVTAGVVLQDLLEVRTAGGQDHLVTLDCWSILENSLRKNCIPN